MTPAQDEPVELTRPQCLALLQVVTVGRLAWCSESGEVTVRPVNFAMDGHDVVIRTGPDAKLWTGQTRRRVAFEVDDLEPALQAGWSVLLRGHAQVVLDPVEQERLLALSATPWASGPRPYLLVVDVDYVTGRRLDPHTFSAN